ncbi:hypothetical protein [Desulfolutivibrio sp.]|uniref:hypothetical protein n=1 Tax=Desulfolutivibrio sp. TaxID=2773296 RepID=UPI002F9618CA
MDAQNDVDATADPVDLAASPRGDGPVAPDGPPGAAWDGLLRGLEEKVAGLVENGLTRLGNELDTANRLEAEAAFAAGHPDFAELKHSGRLTAIRRDNPLLDEVGAYFAAMLEREREAVAARLEEASLAAEKRTLESLRSRRLAATLGQGQGAAPDRGGDPELSEPGRFGGMNTVLARRLAARRAAAGN